MDFGLIIALAFGVVIIVLAIVATRMFGERGARPRDRNASRRDGDATATWIGIRSTRNTPGEED